MKSGLASRHGKKVEMGADGVLALELRGDVAPVGAVVLVVHLVGVEAEVAVAVARQRHEERLRALARAAGHACGRTPLPPEARGAVLAVASRPGGNLVAQLSGRGLPLLKRQAELGHVALKVDAHLVESSHVLAHVHLRSPPPLGSRAYRTRFAGDLPLGHTGGGRNNRRGVRSVADNRAKHRACAAGRASRDMGATGAPRATHPWRTCRCVARACGSRLAPALSHRDYAVFCRPRRPSRSCVTAWSTCFGRRGRAARASTRPTPRCACVSVPTGVVVVCRESRSQLQNRQACLAKLRAVFERRSRVPKPRKKTKASRAQKERRLQAKHRASQKKSLRVRVDRSVVVG